MCRISRLIVLGVLTGMLILLGGCPDDNEIIDGIAFVWCPAGSFAMGRAPAETDSSPNEDPQHTVTFAQGFWISKYEITQAQWEAVMGNNPSDFSGGPLANRGNRPVENISWSDTQAFLTALNAARPGINYRLPSEAEWEYACRAGSTTRFFWDDDPNLAAMGDYAWYHANSNNETHDAGGKQPNAWGIYDMCGNVWEWVQDCGHYGYAGAPADGTAWETGDCANHMVRGGSFYNGEGCRSAFRGVMASESRFGDYGFRIVKVPDTEGE